MNKTISLKLRLVIAFLGIFNILNAQQNFANAVSISEDLNGYNWPSLEVHGFGGPIDDNNSHPVINFVRKNGTPNAPTFTKNGDQIGVLGFSGFDGTNVVQNVRISAYAESDYTNGNYANRLDFLVGGNATCCGQTRMSINGTTGNIGIGTTSPGGKLDINFGGWGSIPRVVFKSVSDNPGINFYRPTGSGATAYPWRIEENLGVLEFQTGDFANIGSETFLRKFYLDNNKAFFNDNVGIGTETPENSEGWNKVLNVHGNEHSKIITSTTNVGSGIWSHNDGYYGALPGGILGTYTDHPISFITNKSTQMTITTTGNVGIGTNNPTEKLQIGNAFTFHSGGHDIIGFGFTPSNSTDLNTNAHSAEIRFKKTEGTLALGVSQDNASNPTPALEIWKNNNVTLSYYDWGKVGIGTNTPTEKLDISSDNNSVGLRIGSNAFNLADQSYINLYEGAFHHGIRLHLNGSTNKFSIKTRLDQVDSDALTIPYHGANAGFVGIGTANPDSKLTVKGSIHAEEVKVDLAIAPDYVFEKYYDGYSTLKSDYKMPTLQEVEAYTKENKHLPEVPSAQEIKENGLKLGEMNAILLQKVEELTLYLIEQNKEIEKLKTKVDELSKK